MGGGIPDGQPCLHMCSQILVIALGPYIGTVGEGALGALRGREVGPPCGFYVCNKPLHVALMLDLEPFCPS